MNPEVLELKLHQEFTLEAIMREIQVLPQNKIIEHLLEVIRQIMVTDNAIKYLLIYDTLPLPLEVDELTLGQQFFFQQLKAQKTERSQAIILVEQAWRILMIKSNVVQDLSTKAAPISNYTH
jgi:hypothetical protein